MPQIVTDSSYFPGKLLARLAYIESIPKNNVTIALEEKYADCSSNELLKECANALKNNQIEEAWQLLHLGKLI